MTQRFKTFKDLDKYWKSAVPSSAMAESILFLGSQLRTMMEAAGLEWDWDDLEEEDEVTQPESAESQDAV